MNFYDDLMENARNDGIEKIVVGGIIQNEDGKFLILTRKKTDFMGGIDEISSGNLETIESIYDGLLREVKEETNLSINKVIRYVGSFDYFSKSGKKARQYNFFVEVQKPNHIRLTEHDEFKWLSIDEIRTNSNITEEVKEILEKANLEF